MDKNYDHSKSEGNIYQLWEKSGAFSPPSGNDIEAGQKTFTIIMPPPNANDPLHVGHAMFVTIEDILIRYHRMLGEATLWIPGTDHAGIETQFVFEKKLAKLDKSRFDYDRETLYKMIWEYVEMNSGVAVDQMKKLGASADWSRQKFTLDQNIVDQVISTFVKLHNDGLVYKAERLVNYCTKCGTAYSELEVEYEEKQDKIYTIDYGNGIKVATTRPETLLGDVAVAVHPYDNRYKALIGNTIELPIVGRLVPIIADETVDMKFGTGAVKVTPTHDKSDWEIAERAKMNLVEICAKYTVIGENGKMNANAGKYAGMSIVNAREELIKDLGDKVIEIKDIVHNVGTCYRCHRVIEPLPKSQFFIRVRGMADKVIEAMDKGEITVMGAGHDKILRHWLTNLKDWNVSRQIVWGIQIPAWYPPTTSKHQTTPSKEQEQLAKNTPAYIIQKESPGEGWTQEIDTFDTWFSSGQWPVVTLKTTKEDDFDKYYPTNVLETAYDILPFWVMRMLMFGIYMTGKVPFKTVYLHGLVRDEKGQKMSKSKGNVVNPLELSEKYGTDALRMALVMSTAPGIDSTTGENKVRGMRNFANKIWNAGRFVKEFAEEKEQQVRDLNNEDDIERSTYSQFQQNQTNKMTEVKQNMTKYLSENKVGLAAEYIYNSFWHEFCDNIIERSKNGDFTITALKTAFREYLIMLHPFVPFVTETVWKEIFSAEGLLIEQSWPK